MKIIIRNPPPDVPAPAWDGLKLICGNCKSKFQLEEKDNVATRGFKVSLAKVISVACPVCGVFVEKRLQP